MFGNPAHHWGFDGQSLAPALALIRQESLRALRGARAYGLLSLIVSAMVGVVALYLLDLGRIELSSARAMSELATVMFYTFGYGLYMAGMLLVPPIAAETLCTDKQRERLDLVRLTFIRPSALLFGKFVSISGLYALVATATLPIAGVMFFFTGVGPAQYVQLFLLIFISVASATALGLLFSAWLYRSIVSMILTYLAVVFVHAGLAVLLWCCMILGFSGLPAKGLAQYGWLEPLLATLCPAYGIQSIATAGLHPAFYLIAPAFHGAVILLAAVLASRVLNRPLPAMKVDTREVIDNPTLLEARRRQFPYYLLDPQRRRTQIGDHQNPMYVKERYTGLANRGTTAIRILYCMGIVSVVAGAFMTVMVEYLEDGMFAAAIFVMAETLILVVAAPLFIASALSKEREWGNWDMLRMTLITPRQVVLGKLLAAVRSLALPASALLIGCLPLLVAALGNIDVLSGLSFGVTMMIATLGYVLAISLAAGARHERSFTALASAYGASLVLLLAIPYLAYQWLRFTSPTSTFGAYFETLSTAAWYSPLTVFFLGMDGGGNEPLGPLSDLYILSHLAALTLASLAFVFFAYYRCIRSWNGDYKPSPPQMALPNAKEAHP